MSTILDFNYSILRFNYIIVFFSTIVLLYFFAVIVYRIFSDRTDFNNILNLSNNICVKFDYNGQILEYNSDFSEIATFKNEDVKGYDIFSLIKFDDYEGLSETLFSNSDNQVSKSFISTVTCRNGVIKQISFKGIVNTNNLGAGVTYILVGTDVTKSQKAEKEYMANKNLLEGLKSEFAFAEEELDRNFQQIQDTQEKMDELTRRHKIFADDLPLGIMEYDFATRQLFFSAELLRFFIPNANTASIHTDEAISVFYNFITNDSIYDFLESIYNALTNNTVNFSTKLVLTNSKVFICRYTIIYTDNKPVYMYGIANFNTF